MSGVWEGSPIVEGTTLLKPVPYDDMDKDERDKIINHIERERAKDPTWRTSEEDIEYILPHFKLVGFSDGKSNLKVSSVLQVRSITIFNDDPSWEGAEIHGHITIHGKSVVNPIRIFERGLEDSEGVTPRHNVLSLSDCPVAPIRKGKVKFNLFSSRDSAKIISKSHLVEYDIEIDDDCTQVKERNFIVTGEFGYYARMDYSIIPFAYIANVKLCLVGPASPIDETVVVQGEIKANTFNLLKSQEFKISNSTYITVYIAEQTRNVIAVPVTSLLVVDVSVCRDGREFCTEVAKIDPNALKHTMWAFKCTDKKYYFRVTVEWVSPDKYFGLLPVVTKPLTPPLTPDDNDNYVEIFSVFIGGGGSTPSPIRGSIVVRDRDDTVYIFSRNENFPNYLSWNKRCISLSWPDDRWILERNFYMHLKLQDVHGNPLCRGAFHWWHEDCDLTAMRFDRRLCAVIPGKEGYFAAVHYAIFRDGLRAKVTMTIEVERPWDFFDVYGSVSAMYSNYDYTSAYDKAHYQIIIFKRPEEERAKVENACKIPLSKSLITAPSDCRGLIFHVDLITASPDLFAMGELRFKTGTNGTNASQQVLLRERVGMRRCGHVVMNVEWFDSSHGSRP